MTDAISQIDANQSGIELRTVQLWFQDNERGIGTENIRWLARIFGCGDPDATSTWQRKLYESQALLASKRRKSRDPVSSMENSASADRDATPAQHGVTLNSIALFTEAIYQRRTRLEIPGLIFAGGVILGFTSIMLNVHSYEIAQSEHGSKQIGFLWAPNWTLITWFLMPLFALTVSDAVGYWKLTGRPQYLAPSPAAERELGWLGEVQRFSTSFWAIFLISLPIAFLLQWVVHYLLPLMRFSTPNQATNWGLIALYDTAIISTPAALLFTLCAYLYLGTCIFLFFSGLLLIHIVGEDLHECAVDHGKSDISYNQFRGEVATEVFIRIFRCAIVGLTIPTVIKIQQLYLTSTEKNIADWLAKDFQGFWADQSQAPIIVLDNSVSTNFTSILIVLAIAVVFGGIVFRLRPILARASMGGPAGNPDPAYPTRVSVSSAICIFILMVANYILLGAFSGFSGLLVFTMFVASYAALNPTYVVRRR